MNAQRTAEPFDRIVIIGLGVLGGSLALALRRVTPRPHVLGIDRSRSERDAALAAAAVDAVSDDAADAAGAALVVLATPPSVAAALLEAHDFGDAIITDVCSVKRVLVSAAVRSGRGDRFVGGHPMCGSERSGFAAADGRLYARVRVWLTPAEAASPVARVAAFWQSVGAEPAHIDAAEHDRLVAWSSHVPQLASTALAAALFRSGTPPGALGPGARDMLRIAASPHALWRELLTANGDEVAPALAALRDVLRELHEALAERGERGEGDGSVRNDVAGRTDQADHAGSGDHADHAGSGDAIERAFADAHRYTRALREES